MKKIKHIALVAHDNRKADMIEWVEWNQTVLHKHKLLSTGTTGKLVEEALAKMRRRDDGGAQPGVEFDPPGRGRVGLGTGAAPRNLLASVDARIMPLPFHHRRSGLMTNA